MKWYHFSVEYFEDLRNVNHCEFLIMRKQPDSGKYILENQLRTWSELKRQRLLAAKEKEKNSTAPDGMTEKEKEKAQKLEKGTGTAGTISPIPVRKKWGGCPNGCDHGRHSYKKENSMDAMQINGKSISKGTTIDTILSRRPATTRRWQSSSDEDEDDPRGRTGPPIAVDVQKSLDDVVSSPDGTPSFISVEDRMRNRLKSPANIADVHHMLLVKHAGRDFGGSASGNTSQAGSDTEFSAEEDVKKRLAKGRLPTTREKSGMGRGMKADALGDQSDVGSDGGDEKEVEDLEKAEKEDKSVKGSVY